MDVSFSLSPPPPPFSQINQSISQYKKDLILFTDLSAYYVQGMVYTSVTACQ